MALLVISHSPFVLYTITDAIALWNDSVGDGRTQVMLSNALAVQNANSCTGSARPLYAWQ